MKNFYKILLLLLSLLLITCSDDNSVNNTRSPYNGKWLWLKTVGELFPRVITPNEGTTIKINYDELYTFKLYRNDSLKVEANYKIEESENDWDKISYSNISTNNYNFYSNPEYAEINTDTLLIWDGVIDGYFRFYKKIP